MLLNPVSMKTGEDHCHTRRAERNFALARMSNVKTHA